MRLVVAACAAALSVVTFAIPAGAAGGFDPAVEARNFAITQERQAEYDTPAYQQRLSVISAKNLASATQAQANGPRAVLHEQPVLERRERLRRRRPALQLGPEALRHGAQGAVHRARRRDAVRSRVGDRGRARPSVPAS